MNWKLVLLAAALIGVVVAGLLIRGGDGDRPYVLTILHTNDLHAHYDSFQPWGEPVQGGVARMKTVVDEIRGDEENVLFLDAGDQFQGTLFFTVGGARAVADVMNEFQYDAMCLGNHEFDEGSAELAAFIDLAEFPVLSANTDADADPDLSGKIAPYEIFSRDGDQIAVIGLTSEHTAIASSPGPNVRFLDVVSTARQTTAALEAMGVEVIIALTHLGYERDLELARSVEGIDVIVGGHSHTALDPYPTLTDSSSGEPVVVVTAFEWGRVLGRLDVSFTDDGLVDAAVGRMVPIDETIAENLGMVAVLDVHRPAIDALMTTVVGSASVDLMAASEDIRVRETNLANLICDAMLWKAGDLGATIAIQNGGGIRASIPAGEVAMGQILEVLPYGNQITVLALSGAELIQTLENGVSEVEQGSGRFPHVGGMRFVFDPAAAPGARIDTAEVWDAEAGAYVVVDPAATYTIATNSFLADGGDGYAEMANAVSRYDTGWLLSDTLAEYLAEQGSVAPEVEGRISESP